MSEVQFESIKTIESLNNAVSYAEKVGTVKVKKLARMLHISPSSAAKLTAVLTVCGVLGESTKKGHLFVGAKRFSTDKESYLIIEKIDDAEQFAQDYLSQLLMPALKLALEFGNIGVSVLERRMGLVYGRAAEIMDLLASAEIIGGVCEINFGRTNMLMPAHRFDELSKLVDSENALNGKRQ